MQLEAQQGMQEHMFKKLGYKYYSINGIAGISSRGPDPTSPEDTSRPAARL